MEGNVPAEIVAPPLELTTENVSAIVRYCLYRDDELPGDGSVPEGAAVVAGVVSQFGFHLGRLTERAGDIRAMLAQLPDSFRADAGGGWSFLNACMRADGAQWGEHRNIDELLCLGLATGSARILLPREFWPSLPGGMPYFSVTP